MIQRRITEEEVRMVLERGEVVDNYPQALPYPARLVLAWVGGRPLHVVSAQDPGEGDTFIITVYEPDGREWEPDFRRRKQ
ncbi:MAG: DUF4258 domain-containing protein [Chloroflexi bacterium]|nr:DUF4258 domain-containing protein [Chloroflexota bacterium]